MAVEQQHLSYAVPGVYLIRAGDLSLDELCKELSGSGLLFCRRFLARAARSDYLTVFDPTILVEKFRLAETVTPVNSWAGRIKKEPEDVLPKSKTVVVTALEKKVKPDVSEPKNTLALKKNRPGKRARQMLKALIASTTELPPVPEKPQPMVENVKIEESPPVILITPSQGSDIPQGVDLLVTGSGETHPVLRLRPFRVSADMEANPEVPGMMTIPHLTIYHPPRSDSIRKNSDSRALEYVDKCHSWIKNVLKTLRVCGALPADSACQVTLAEADTSRLSRGNLLSMQCRFQDGVSMSTRNAVYAVLRSSVWFQGLASDISSDTQQYLVRCWWRQVPVTAV